jgi:hypothetical protein
MQNEVNKQVTSEDRHARNGILEGIFIPHARRRRDQFYQPGTPNSQRFIHYTSAEAAIKIINKKRLWLRNSACMADYREVQHGFSILLRYFSVPSQASAFKDAINVFAPGAADEAIKNFDKWWTSGTIPFKTFIASVSEHDADEDFHGRLSMWRAFHGSTARVGLVFNIPFQSPGAEAMRLIFSPVAYFKDAEADQLVPQVIKNINANIPFLSSVGRQEIVNWVFAMLLLGVTCVKHEGFREEREWRVVYCPHLYPSPLIESANETVGGIPQIVFKLPLDKSLNPVLADLDISNLFERLIIGPSPFPVAMADAFADALTKAGVADADKKLFISNIPIRS